MKAMYSGTDDSLAFSIYIYYSQIENVKIHFRSNPRWRSAPKLDYLNRHNAVAVRLISPKFDKPTLVHYHGSVEPFSC